MVVDVTHHEGNEFVAQHSPRSGKGISSRGQSMLRDSSNTCAPKSSEVVTPCYFDSKPRVLKTEDVRIILSAFSSRRRGHIRAARLLELAPCPFTILSICQSGGVYPPGAQILLKDKELAF